MLHQSIGEETARSNMFVVQHRALEWNTAVIHATTQLTDASQHRLTATFSPQLSILFHPNFALTGQHSSSQISIANICSPSWICKICNHTPKLSPWQPSAILMFLSACNSASSLLIGQTVWLLLIRYSYRLDIAKQETQLSLRKRATHLCKCNDVIDLLKLAHRHVSLFGIWSFCVKQCRHKYRRTPKIGERSLWKGGVADFKTHASSRVTISNLVIMGRRVYA